ncbi:unnamed protein product [Paramecium sonneborni]|uniref:Transmembrane protein n=1 Tax=Paramecium sonneborni TaxID=65129 RepID=A0A8S1NY40_9CILI|nr:unnamed protein product [Paramecium sonneborni]
MNKDNQIQTYNFQIDLEKYIDDFSFAFGLWSKYLPLSWISQIGKFGILDSNCYHLHSAQDSQTNEVIFLYSDCLDYNKQKIKKQVQFFSNDEQYHNFEVVIDANNYENVWFYFQITDWPQYEYFELIFLQYPHLLSKKVLQIKYPYNTNKLLLTFGGGLYIESLQQFENDISNKIYTYYPGKFYLSPLTEISRPILTYDSQISALSVFEPINNCLCQSNLNSQFKKQQLLTQFQKELFTSENANCASFGLQGWLKIKEIHQIDDVFDYKFMKMNKFSQNQKLNDDNLSAFQLIYKISKYQFKILILTYSYSFPSVNIDQINNSFLIKKEIKIINNIYLWHSLQVYLLNNNLQIKIRFYEGDNIYLYEEQINVYHFNEVQFQINYGNINQEAYNYLNIQIENLNYYNCDTQLIDKSCHPSCEKCDGPTNSDCLSCSQISNRIYIPQQKACICNYNAIDQDFCYQIDNFHFQVFNLQQEESKYQSICQYGYFQLDSQICIKCPAIIKPNLITCLECILNPLNWKEDPYCQESLYIIEDNTFNSVLDEKKSYFILPTEELQLCQDCTAAQMQNELTLYNYYIKQFKVAERFCQKSKRFYNINDVLECYDCNLDGCLECVLTEQGLICILCLGNLIVKNGQCFDSFKTQFITQNQCLPPFYISSTRGCKLCQIQNCKYCFEYKNNDLKSCTLYDNFETFEEDEFHSVGCSLCEDNFLFDFTVGLCLYQKPNLQYCLRSFINLEGSEICTLSSVDDFRIAQEIINCEKLINNCLQCVLISSLQIKCVICAQGFTSSLTSGLCYRTPNNNSKISIEGDGMQLNGWIQLIQSFLMNFLPNQYYNQIPPAHLITPISIVCIDGYQISNKNTCKKYCSSDCLICEDTQDLQFTFQCKKCSLDYYRLHFRSKIQNQCLKCSPLCSICQPRTQLEIKLLNGQFEITDSNIIYTHKCLYQAPDPNIIIIQNELIPQYCFAQNCSQFFQYEYEIDFETVQLSLSSEFQQFYENDINTDYLNQIGIRVMRINFLYSLPLETQFIIQDYQMIKIDSTLKQKVFSIRQVIFNITKSQIINNIVQIPLIINNFDTIEIQNMIFIINKDFYLKFDNDQSIDLYIEDTLFQGSLKDYYIELFLMAKDYNKFRLANLTYENLFIKNSLIWDISFTLSGSFAQISHINFINCVFQNSSIFNFHGKIADIQIFDVTFYKCIFLESIAFNFQMDYQQSLKLQIIKLNLSQSTFLQSNLITSYFILMQNIQDISITQNNFTISKIFISNSKFQIVGLKFISNLLQNSCIFIAQQIAGYIIEAIQFIDNKYINNRLVNSIILDTNSQMQSNSFSLYLKNIVFQNNYDINYAHLNSFLFNIQSKSLTIIELYIIDCYNLQFFNFYLIDNIYFDKIELFNTIQITKIPLSIECANFKQLNKMFLKAFGIQNFTLTNFLVQNYFFVDQTLIYIQSQTQHDSQFIEQLYFSNLTFTQNILLKITTQNIFTLLAIYSAHEQNILIKEINFTENLFHQYTNDLSSQSSGLIFIDSYLSKVKISNLYNFQNILANSSHPFQYIKSNIIIINNFVTSNLNILSNELFEKYYNIQFQSQLKEEFIQDASQQLLIIQNQVGVLQVATSMFIFNNGTFEKIRSQNSAIFAITTKDPGLISIKNIIVSNIEVDLIQESNIYGCITIFAQSSILKFEIQNASFKNVFNIFGSSIFTIFPSLQQNRIEIINIYIQDCLSFVNQILKLEFAKQTKEQNFITFQNITIIQRINAWIQYFQSIGPLSYQEVSKLSNDNAIINLIGCNIKIFNFSIEGAIISPVLKIIDCNNFQFIHGNFYDLLLFFPFGLISIEQDISKQMSISLSKINLKSISFQQNSDDIILRKISLKIFNNNILCIPIFQIEISYKIYQFSNILDQINQNYQLANPLIYFFSINNSSKFILQEIYITNINCLYCELGIINFDIRNFQQIKISKLLCYSNSIQKKGCISIMSNNTLKNIAVIKNSKFINNYGSQGAGLSSSNINLILIRCLFLKNFASMNGGAIYFYSYSNYFKFFEVSIINNTAKVGGGIYLIGNNSLNQFNFIKSSLLFNKGLKGSNNLVEIPDHLGLSINNQEMISYQNEDNSFSTNILYLKEYQTIQQGRRVKTSHLMIPSNQKIGNYSLFSTFRLDYKVLIHEISISFRNYMNELLTLDDNQICELSQTIVSEQGLILYEQKFISKLSYNYQSNKYDLGTEIIQFDPYQHYDKQLKISIDCILQQISKRLRYIIYTKTYFCQLGEYYVDEGCQKCQSNQGYYSVTYNATKCSIFDNKKFENITSNLIFLKTGFWRSSYTSDLTEQCFKNLIFCQGGWDVGDQSCQLGHIGGLCEECDIYNIKGFGQYFKSQTNMQCYLCPKESINILPFIFVSIWSLLSIFLSVRSIEKTNLLYSSLSFKQRFRRIIFKLNQDHQSFLIKMLLNYLWIYSVIFSFNLNFTFSITILESVNNSSLVLANSLDCFLSKSLDIELIYFRIIIILVLIIGQLLLFCICFKLHSIFSNYYFRTSIVTNIVLCLYLQNNAILIKQFFSLLAKRQISSIEFIQGDVSLKFESQSHYKWIFTFLLPGVILIGCGIPILLFLLMILKKEKLESIQLRRHIGYLFNEYNQSSYYWEYIKIWKKNVIIIIVVYFETNIFLKASLLGICLLLYQSLSSHHQPFIIKSLNILDIQTCQICSLIIYLAVIIFITQQQNNQIYSVILQIFIFLLWTRIFYSFVIQIILTYLKKYKIAILTFILQIAKKIQNNSKLSSYLEKNIQRWQLRNGIIIKNYQKVKLYLISLSKVQIENQKLLQNSNLIPLSSLRIKISSQENEKNQLI